MSIKKQKKSETPDPETENKLQLVPAAGSVVLNPLFTPASDAIEIPKNAVKLTKPPLVKLESIPVGARVTAKIVDLVESISDRANMKEAKLIHLAHPNGTEFLIPLTGVIKKAIGGFEGVKKNVGKTLILVRQADGSTTKYGGEKKVFMFDIYLA